MAVAILDVVLQTGAFSMVRTTTNLDGHIRVWRRRGERTSPEIIHHRHTAPSPGLLIWDAIEYTSWSILFHIADILNLAKVYISDVLRLVLYPLFEPCEILRFSRIILNRMLPVLCGPFLIRKIFGCCSDPHVHQISRQKKTSGSWLLSDWLVTIRQSLLLMSCGIVLKLHGHLYLYMSSNFCLTQCSMV
ncbi:hypothetical protein TNCV_1930921 [Trichonephila clavipes]|nr:hypothetical protein TNCV_1930921 [Trichonephila clavipes]